ncbi:adenosine deaminase domain-containing protein 1 isoform X1 [Octopus sinensis]|uniref:Adenosine deaminase domain-containing protein 1 isoform X1 n=1 Tax=Octopus sinensis TaxID=2607531 RepID=A0A6P7TSS5_9MOLL|nr:adenosine deaminase domain-containing protein 1 isoform X1 [Octopus sinensis]
MSKNKVPLPKMYQGMESGQKHYEKKTPPNQPYIPGLSKAPPNSAPVSCTLARASETLIKEYQSKEKNPVQCLHEYASQRKVKLSFHEVDVLPSREHPLAIFAVQVEINNVMYPQGVGNTKKEAKTNAAIKAFEIGVLQKSNGNECVSQTVTNSQPSLDLGKTAEKHSVTQLYEYALAAGKSCEIVVGDERGPMGFKACVMLNNEYFVEAVAQNKKEAKRLAGVAALEKLNIRYAQEVAPEGKSLGQQFTDLVYNHLYMYLEQYSVLRYRRKSVAAVILVSDNKPEVISMAIGHQCLTPGNLSSDGRCLIDSDAAVLACRAFRRYLYLELQRYLAEPNSPICIYEMSPESGGLLNVKKDVTFHLFLSDPPSGDYSIFLSKPSALLTHEDNEEIARGVHKPAFEESDHGALSLRYTDGSLEHIIENTVVRETMDITQSRQEQLQVMSTCDKILKWNVLGVQGCLLTKIMAPFYFSSITLASQFDHGHLSRAVCCRLYDELNSQLPRGYSINHPWLYQSFIPPIHDLRNAESTELALNWAKGQDKIELTNGLTGRIVTESPTQSGATMSSRLCKAAMLRRFRQYCEQSHMTDVDPSLSYAETKQSAAAYQEAKTKFYEHCVESSIGGWVRKPVAVDEFLQ